MTDQTDHTTELTAAREAYIDALSIVAKRDLVASIERRYPRASRQGGDDLQVEINSDSGLCTQYNSNDLHESREAENIILDLISDGFEVVLTKGTPRPQ